MSIEGSAPSIFQATATQFLFNRPQSYTVAQAKETARGAGFGTAARRNEVAYRTASLYLDAERASRLAATARKELDSLQKVQQTVESQVAEGRLLPIERTRAALTLAQARLTVQNLEADQMTAETALAAVLGYGAEDRVQPAQEVRPVSPVPPEETAVESALQSNKELRQIESQIAAKELEIRATKAQRLPRVDLVAQYSMLARYNNYEEFFRKFQRNNGQLGMSFQIPILPGPGVSASVAQSQADITRLRTELRSMRNKIVSDTRQSYRELRRAQTAQEVAKLDLDLAREQLSVLLAQMQEGRAALRQVEEARVAETNKWIAFYDAQYVLERARILVLHNAGELAASLR
jgi:outer membrane protein TolC